MKELIAVIGLLMSAGFCAAQSVGFASPLPGSAPPRPPDGKVYSTLHPFAPVMSLDMLVGMSEVILDGTVASVLPSFNRNPEIPHAMETDSFVTVNELLSGKLPPGTHAILLAQIGGKAGQWEEVVPDDPLVQRGERYIFFLRPDTRKEPANTLGVPRFFATGIWAGRAKVDRDGKIQFLPSAAPKLHACDNKDASAFIAIVKDRVSAHTWKPMPYPRGARVLKPPPGTIFPVSPLPPRGECE